MTRAAHSLSRKPIFEGLARETRLRKDEFMPEAKPGGGYM